jgi:hypothetical protein
LSRDASGPRTKQNSQAFRTITPWKTWDVEVTAPTKLVFFSCKSTLADCNLVNPW